MMNERERRAVVGGDEAPEDVAPPKRRFARRARIGMLSSTAPAPRSDAAEAVGAQRAFTAVLTHATRGVVSFRLSTASETAVLTEATRQAKYRGGHWRIRVYEAAKLIAAREPGCSQWQRPAPPPATPADGPSTGGQGGTPRAASVARDDAEARAARVPTRLPTA